MLGKFFEFVRSDILGILDMKNFYYFLNFGVVYFVWIFIEIDFILGSDQYKWIVEDLKNMDCQKMLFIVF